MEMGGIRENDAVEASPALTTPQMWRGYLREYSALYLRTANEYQRAALDPEQAATHWMGHEPAPMETVLAAEQRLGVRFPPSFRSFLLVSDGWRGVGGPIHLVLPCERISWLRDTDRGADLIDIYSEYANAENEYVTLLAQSLDIAEGDAFWLLDPTETGPDGEWAACLFEPKHAEWERFASFAELFHTSRKLMAQLEQRDTSGQ
jgi:hypothetical protein